MQDLNTIPSVGTFGEVARNANTNFSLLKIAVDLLEHSIEHSRGYFTSASALTTAFPSPVVGDWAIVEVSGTPTIYKCSTRGTWSNSGTVWAGGSIDLAEYLRKNEGDDYIIAGSNNYPTGNAVYDAISEKVNYTLTITTSTLRKCYINASGNWYNVTYRHIIIPVVAGDSFFVKSNNNKPFTYAWLTSNSAPSHNTVAPLVTGTSRVQVPAGSTASISAPIGAEYMYILCGETQNDALAGQYKPAIFQQYKLLKEIYEEDFATLPTTVSNIKEKTDIIDSGEGSLVGEGATLSYSPYMKWMIKGHRYRVHIDNTVPTTESASLSSSYVQFRVLSYDSVETATALITCYVGVALRQYYDFTVPQSSASIRVVCRCDTGYSMSYRIEDITDTQINDTGFYYLRGMYYVKSLTTKDGKFESAGTTYFVYYRECTAGQQIRLEMSAIDAGATIVWGFCVNKPAAGGEQTYVRSKTFTNAGDSITEYLVAPSAGYIFVRKQVNASSSSSIKRSNSYLYTKSTFNQLGFYVHKIATPTFKTNRGIVVNEGTDKAQGSVHTSFGSTSYGLTELIDISAYSYLLLRQTYGTSGNLYNKVYNFGSAFYDKDEQFLAVADVAQYASSGRSGYCIVAVPTGAKYVRLFGVVSSYLYYFGIDREISEEEVSVPDIVKLNNPDDLLNKMQQLNRYKGNNEIKQLVMLHFSDIHSDERGLKRVKTFYDYYKNYIDDVIHTGDINSSYDTYDMTFWNNANAAKFLNVIGNHDCAYVNTEGHPVDSGGNLNEVPASDCYTKYFAPYVDQWGVTINQGVCYYYKDYATAKVRLIVVDEYHYDQIQRTWLVTTLADALTNDLHVLMATHSSIVNSFEGAETTFAQMGSGWGAGRQLDKVVDGVVVEGSGTKIMNDVQDFIDNGGQLICWICGHAHYDHCGFPARWPEQFKIIVSTQSIPRAANYNVARVEKTKSEDSFNIFSIDTKYKYFRVMKIGADRDRCLRHLDSFYYNYGTRKIYHEQNVPDISGKEDKMGVEEYVDGTTVVTAGKCYVVDASSANVPITLPDVSETHFMSIIFYVTTGASTAISISAPTGGTLLYADSYPSTFDASSTYEVNCLWNGMNWILAAMKLKTTL